MDQPNLYSYSRECFATIFASTGLACSSYSLAVNSLRLCTGNHKTCTARVTPAEDKEWLISQADFQSTFILEIILQNIYSYDLGCLRA